MRKIIPFIISAAVLLAGCSKAEFEPAETTPEVNEQQAQGPLAPTTKLSEKQALLFAGMLANVNDGDVTLEATKGEMQDREVSDIQYYVLDRDTLLYAINYGANDGFIILSADNSSSPILAQSRAGRLNFDEVDSASYLSEFLYSNARRVQKNMYNPGNANTDYYDDWADLGKEGYEYIIEAANDEPSAPKTRSGERRDYSSGKESIYPYTGKELDAWCQRGGYNMSAPNLACIGCPAIACGMLLYDVHNRVNGNGANTNPSFTHSDSYGIEELTTESSLSERLKQIADKIPGYDWGSGKDKESGASPSEIQLGLSNMGFKDIDTATYNFETLYNELTFQGIGYGGTTQTYTRGILLGAYHQYSGGGHIWFCDGYYEQAFTVTKKFLGITIKTWTEYDDRIYMNWGWADGSNGWYAANEDAWTSIEEGGQTNYFKRSPIMYVFLDKYEIPE